MGNKCFLKPKKDHYLSGFCNELSFFSILNIVTFTCGIKILFVSGVVAIAKAAKTCVKP